MSSNRGCWGMSELDYMFYEPAFVKEASSADLDASSSDAVVVGDGFRIDNKAAAWASAARIRKNASAGVATDISVKNRVAEACSLFGITDSDFSVRPIQGEHIIVKNANYNADMIICNQSQFDEAVQTFIKKRASAPIQFCRECASKLLQLQHKYGYTTDSATESKLYKMAGTIHHDMEGFAREVDKRVKYATVRCMNEEADALKKLAHISRQTADDTSGIFSNVLVDTLDEFDRATGLVKKLASENMKHPEDVMYLLPDEYIRKRASSDLKIGDRSVKRGFFMRTATQDAIRKWASACGEYIPQFATPEEFASVLNSMTGCLQDEFFERAGNGERFDFA